MAEKPPYVTAYGNITKVLQQIQSAAVPSRFTQDFLATKLNLKGGSPKPVIPFLKRTGFLGSDGVPTDLYKRFRNASERGKAANEALRKGYSSLYEVNEYIHDAADKEVKGVIVQVTGVDQNSNAVKATMGSFRALKEFATFNGDENSEADVEEKTVVGVEVQSDEKVVLKNGLGLSYTLNLNLPATSDITVFNAIFKSLKENLLK
ncbi:MAG: hypothetical protein NPIRA04_18870 [Nitrospirales bacterium]|nr:MAG: hypothetical protein NPIRA04_18870 [Nitrospirales bacterium]